MPGLGRIYAPDNRDATYPMRALMAAPPAPLPATRIWPNGPITDQGQTPRCVGYGCRDWLTCDPNDYKKSSPTPLALYRAAQKLDGIPGKHDGSSVRAGLQALQARKLVASYHWATQIADVRDYILGFGPVIVGTSWYETMFQPDTQGRVSIGGAVAGGHCWLVIGYASHTRLFTGQNSWGPTWAMGGLFTISENDLSRLLSEQGEAAAALEH